MVYVAFEFPRLRVIKVSRLLGRLELELFELLLELL